MDDGLVPFKFTMASVDAYDQAVAGLDHLITQANQYPRNASAQFNLTNAIAAVKALYQVTHAYKGTTTAYTAATFASQAPEFNWMFDAACPTAAANCVSVLVFAVSSAGDAQGSRWPSTVPKPTPAGMRSSSSRHRRPRHSKSQRSPAPAPTTGSSRESRRPGASR